MGLIIKTQEVRPRNFMVTLDGRLDTLTYAQLDSTLKMIFCRRCRVCNLILVF